MCRIVVRDTKFLPPLRRPFSRMYHRIKNVKIEKKKNEMFSRQIFP